MQIEPLSVKQQVSIRWPFRLLAAAIVFAAVVGVIGNGFLVWSQGTSTIKWQTFLVLPGVAWLGRLAWAAAVRGKTPTSACWPFASDGMFLWYLIICAFALHA